MGVFLAKRVVALAFTAGVLTSMTGCIAVGGRHDVEPPTMGEELIDLQHALNQGAITQEEYDAAKAKLIEDSPWPGY